jgi:hypothetical protein
MAIVNKILRTQGNKAYPANALAFYVANQVNGDALVGDGTTLEVTFNTIDANDNDLGAQNFTYTVSAADPGWDADRLGLTLYDMMRNACVGFREAADPTISCWASGVSNDTARLNMQPKGSDGEPFPARVDYYQVILSVFTFTPVAPG